MSRYLPLKHRECTTLIANEKGNIFCINIIPTNMKQIELNISYTSYTLDELDPEILNLFSIAEEMLEQSYSPYSNFKVSSALITNDGKIFKGCNQENASYPLCICAERVALYNYGTVKDRTDIKSLVIMAKNPTKMMMEPVSPCGACRQVIVEFEDKQSQPIEIYLKAESDLVYKLDSGKTLLPLSFSGDVL